MKRVLLSLLFAMAGASAYAQLNLEQSYPAVWNVFPVKLEDIGDKYVLYDTMSRTVKIYNLDHSLWKEINYNPGAGWKGSTPGCASTKFFNTDGKVELALALYKIDTNPVAYHYSTHIINEDGVLISKLDDVLYVTPKKVSTGWKLIAQKTQQYATDVYGVPGSMPEPSGLKPGAKISDETSIYPNPMDASATLTYTLPEGMAQASLTVYNNNGQRVKQMTVTNQFSNVILFRGDLPAGTYIYEVAGQKQQFVIR